MTDLQRRRIGINGFRRDVETLVKLADRAEWDSIVESDWRVVR